jgi:hypothetical protein
MLKKNVLNELGKWYRALDLNISLLEMRVNGHSNNLKILTERMNAIEKYLGISFTVEEIPAKITRSYKKNKLIKKNK